MLRRMFVLALAALLMIAPATAEFTVQNTAPEGPMETENDWVYVSAVYDGEGDQTRYTIRLKDAAQFPDGTNVTAQDLLFTYYVYLDPSYAGAEKLNEQGVLGLEDYRWQMDVEAALAMRDEIRAAGRDHVWTAEDGWTEELQNAYWEISDAYAAACEAEYKICVEKIVEVCREKLLNDGRDVFGVSAQTVADTKGLLMAYSMIEWGYARCTDDITLQCNRSGKIWMLDDETLPLVEDFVYELKQVYGSDLAACWAAETTGTYEPVLPDVREQFLEACSAGQPGQVIGAEGVSVVDEKTVEVLLTGVDMQSERSLLGIPVLSLAAYGDAAQWNPGEGLYGHAFGDVSGIEAAVAADGGAQTVQLMEDAPENTDVF